MIRVRALETGIYGISRYKAGMEFTIKSRAELGKWMEVLEDDTEKPSPKPAAKKPTESNPL